MAIRLKDTARDLNVSVITVSKAIRGNTDISEATRQRVLARVKELDYQPNMMARSLASRSAAAVHGQKKRPRAAKKGAYQ